MTEIFFVEILFPVHKLGFAAQGDRQLPGQSLGSAFDRVIGFFKVDVHRIRRQMSVDGKSGRIARFGVKDDAAEGEGFPVIPGPFKSESFFVEELEQLEQLPLQELIRNSLSFYVETYIIIELSTMRVNCQNIARKGQRPSPAEFIQSAVNLQTGFLPVR